MEAAADRAYEMSQKFDLEPGVIVNITTPVSSTNGVWLGKSTVDKANCYSSGCTGVAKIIYKHLKALYTKGDGCMVWTDLNASLQRKGNGPRSGGERFVEFVQKHGAAEIFCAADASPDDVSLALCADGAAGDDGVVELVLPVWCSAAGTDVTLRLFTCETAASSYFTCFSSTFCDRSRASRHGR